MNHQIYRHDCTRKTETSKRCAFRFCVLSSKSEFPELGPSPGVRVKNHSITLEAKFSSLKISFIIIPHKKAPSATDAEVASEPASSARACPPTSSASSANATTLSLQSWKASRLVLPVQPFRLEDPAPSNREARIIQEPSEFLDLDPCVDSPRQCLRRLASSLQR